MSVASTSAPFSQAAAGAPAGIQAWTGELVGELIALGMIQTQDTGQLVVTGSGATATTNAIQPTGVGIANAVGHILLSLPDTLSGGPISALVETTAGTTYTASATFTGIVITGATSGANTARATNIVSAGGVPSTTYTITTAGSGYIPGEKLTFSGGTDGAGHTFTTAGTAAIGMPTVLSSGSPIVIRLDFGANSVVTNPQMWITVGTGSNGSGTINGSAGTTAMTQVACGVGDAPLSTVANYISRYCVNLTYGYIGAAMKYGGTIASAGSMGFTIFRSNDANGAATGVALNMLTNSYTTTSITSAPGYIQCGLYGAGVFSSIPVTVSANANCWLASNQLNSAGLILGLTSTLVGGDVTVLPMYCIGAGSTIAFSAYNAVGLATEEPVGTTIATAIVGATVLTFLSIGSTPWGGSSGYFGQTSNTVMTFLMLWM